MLPVFLWDPAESSCELSQVTLLEEERTQGAERSCSAVAYLFLLASSQTGSRSSGYRRKQNQEIPNQAQVRRIAQLSPA